MKQHLILFLRRVVRWRARKNLRRNPVLWKELVNYMKHTKSTGVSWSDFWELYSAVRSRKPREILECGPGASTVAMAYALMENAREGHPGRITAMEEEPQYLEYSVSMLPEYLREYVDYVLSPRIDDCYEVFRGVRYRDTPARDYDFVFVDGPDHQSPTDNAFCFDFDFLHLLRNTSHPVSGLVDYRLSTSWVLQTVLGTRKFRFSLIKELGYIEPVTRHDLKHLSLADNTASLMKVGRVCGSTRLQLY